MENALTQAIMDICYRLEHYNLTKKERLRLKKELEEFIRLRNNLRKTNEKK